MSNSTRKTLTVVLSTGKSLSEAFNVTSNNPQNDKDCSLIYTFSTRKLQAQNMLSYCGLVDVRINASDKDLPVLTP